jgi:hypothetical protein
VNAIFLDFDQKRKAYESKEADFKDIEDLEKTLKKR